MTITEAKQLADAARAARAGVWRGLRDKNEPTLAELHLFRRTYDAELVRTAHLQETIEHARSMWHMDEDPQRTYAGDAMAWMFRADAIDAETGLRP